MIISDHLYTSRWWALGTMQPYHISVDHLTISMWWALGTMQPYHISVGHLTISMWWALGTMQPYHISVDHLTISMWWALGTTQPYHISVDHRPQPVDVHVLQQLFRVLDGGHLACQVLHNVLQHTHSPNHIYTTQTKHRRSTHACAQQSQLSLYFQILLWLAFTHLILSC